MLGGTVPEATCAQIKETVDRQMGRIGATNDAVCGALGTTADVVYIADDGSGYGCERIDTLDPKLCSPWTPSYPADPTCDIASSLSFDSSRSSHSSGS